MTSQSIRNGIAVLLAAAAVILTFFPPPALPLRGLPAVSAVVLATMLIWSRRETPEIPAAHGDELRSLGRAVLNNLNSKQTIQFPGTALESQQLHQAFRAHFPRYAQQLDHWNTLAKAWNDAFLGIELKARAVAGARGFQSGGQALYAVAAADIKGEAPPASTFSRVPQSNRTTALLYGQYQVALLSDPTAQQVSEKESEFAIWPEVQTARRIRVELDEAVKELSLEAAKISMSHNLRVSAKCTICPR